jgi:alkyl sulfatase BDS1-like metallo-beta-lactamase superfamily hydrolase
MTQPIETPDGHYGHPDLIHYRPQLKPEVIRLTEHVFCIFGLSLANCQVIETSSSLLVVDSGHSDTEGQQLRKLIREQISPKPIAAVLYTHSHYIRGTTALLDGDSARIIAHPRVDLAVQRRAQHGGARVRLETGATLPQTGPNAVIAPAPAAKGPNGYRAATETVLPGDQLIIDGVTIDILPGCFDTDDGLAFGFPDFSAVAHNLVVSQMPNFGSLAGGRFRDPLPWLVAVDHLLQRPPEHLLPCHGRPLSGREKILHRLQVNHQAVDHLYRAVMNGLSQGATIPDLIRDVHLPEALREDPDLRQLYGTVPHLVAAIAHGETGFWSGEIRDLTPLHPDQEATALAAALGGPQQILQHAQTAAHTCLTDGDAHHLPWAMHLADVAVRLKADGAHDLRAQLLEFAGYRSSAWTERNTLLSLAHEDRQYSEE